MRVHCVSVRYCVILHIKMSQQQNKNILPTLTLVKKLEIKKKIENGDKLVDFANEFEVGCAKMYNIRKKS